MKARIGIFGIGLEAYWAQFTGLKERLEAYQAHVEQEFQSFGATIISAGLVDNHTSAMKAAELFTKADTDFLVCYVGTYATSSTDRKSVV